MGINGPDVAHLRDENIIQMDKESPNLTLGNVQEKVSRRLVA